MASRKKNDDIQVMIPYPRLQELLEASLLVDDLKQQNERLQTDMSALRYQFTELLERFREIQD